MSTTWHRSSLLRNLKPLDLTLEPDFTEEEQAYLQYYGLDLKDQRPGVRQYLGYVSAYSFRVAVQVFKPERPRATVMVLHGYFDHVGLYHHLIRYLVDKQYTVVSYDLPGHGLSTGEPAAITSFVQYQSVLSTCLRAVKGALPEPLFAVGQSTGAAVLIDYFLSMRHHRTNSAFRSVVFLAPLVRPFGWKSSLLLLSVLKPFFKTWKRVFRDNSSDHDFLLFLREEDPLQSKVLSVDWVAALREWIPRIEAADPVDMPVTIIQGERDGTVDWRHNLVVLSRKFNPSDVFYMKNAEHHLVNEDPATRERIFTLVNNTFTAALAADK
ncbi:MAG: alpha/beta hydrolase [Pseudomonadales bacterium]|nr:alpha/beta hydrolase [Pseudomonadales bacterium]